MDNNPNDIRLEKRLSGAGGFNPASDLDRVPLARRCVVRIWHDNDAGSGLLLPGNWLLTNNHVLPTAEKAKDAIAQFNYERQPSGHFSDLRQHKFDPDAGFYTDEGDDWTVVKLKGDPNAEFGFVALEQVTPELGGIVHIIQHPDAGPKQVADGPILEIADSLRRIRYRANTMAGSSGSPVFNNRWQVVGLHNGSAMIRDPATCASVECNQAIHIEALLEGLQRVGVWPHQAAAGDVRFPDGSWNIERKPDREALRHLQRLRVTVALKGGAQMGKNAIANRVQRQLAAEGWRQIAVDLRHEFAEGDYQTGHEFMRRLAKHVLDRANAEHSLLAAFDSDGAPTALKTFLENLKENRPDYRLLLTLYRVDALYGCPCSSVVLSGLRVVHNWQRELLENGWLRMMLIYDITPRQTGPLGSIFDVAKVIEVTDFSEGELQKLAQLYGLFGIDLPRLLAFLGGHPALSQSTLRTMKEDEVSLDEIISDARKTGGIFRQHLDHVTKDFRDLPDARELARSFRSLIGGTPLDSEDTFDALFALGVIKGTYSGDAVVRCELYQDWLPPRIPR
jgi:hypothetical protein